MTKYQSHFVRTTLCMYAYSITRDKSMLLLFSPVFLSGNSFFLPIMLKILLDVPIICSKLSYIASYITVTSYTLNCIYTS